VRSIFLNLPQALVNRSLPSIVGADQDLTGLISSSGVL